MKIVKLILIIIGIIIAIPLLVALFVKKEYTIERNIVIDRPVADVFAYVRLAKNQDHYSKWMMIDPGMDKEFTGTDGTVGFIYAWDSEDKNAGKGEQEIIAIEENQRILFEVRFEKPFAGVAHSPLITDSLSANQTRVTWGMTGKSNYPLNIMNLFVDGMLGEDLESSLATLKGILEKQ